MIGSALASLPQFKRSKTGDFDVSGYFSPKTLGFDDFV